MTSRRVNALECVVIPVIEDVIQYIKTEMDEESREEFFRVKKVVSKKREKEEAARGEKAAEEAALSPRKNILNVGAGAKDEDIVF